MKAKKTLPHRYQSAQFIYPTMNYMSFNLHALILRKKHYNQRHQPLNIVIKTHLCRFNSSVICLALVLLEHIRSVVLHIISHEINGVINAHSNQCLADELWVTPGTLLNFIPKQKLSYFRHIKRHQTLVKLMLEGKAKRQRNTGRPKWSSEKDVDDWMGASVWRVGRTVEDRLMYRRPNKVAVSGNG